MIDAVRRYFFVEHPAPQGPGSAPQDLSSSGKRSAPQGLSPPAKRPAQGIVLPCMKLEGTRDDGTIMRVMIPKGTEASCYECGEQRPLKELLRHYCSEYSGSDIASLQSEKLTITNPEKTYRDHQLTALAWILKPYNHQWNELAKELGLPLSERENVEARYDGDLRVLAVLTATSEWLKQYGVVPMNKGDLINALQKIQVETSILKKINTAKFAEKRSFSRLVTMQADCSDEQKIIISDPDKLVAQDELKGIKDALSIYAYKWKELAMVFYYPLSAIENLDRESNLRNLYGVLSLNCVLEPRCFSKRLIVTALQLIGVERSGLEEINRRL